MIYGTTLRIIFVLSMKFFETHFEEYVTTSAKHNFHPRLKIMYDKFPVQLTDMKHIILYGPPGTGKYTQALTIINKYSPSGLKYEKKTIVRYNNGKHQYVCKISDIHYEVDMSLLGCNSKTLWHEIHAQITDIVGGTLHKTGIILCKNMHVVSNDLLDVMYSYMQNNCMTNPIQLKYMFIAESVCFLPDSIVKCCELISINRPRSVMVQKHVRKRNPDIVMEGTERASNMKALYSIQSQSQVEVFEVIVQNIVNAVTSGIVDVNFLDMRECIYDLFVYDANVHRCMWSVLSTLIKKEYIDDDVISVCVEHTYEFFKLYNNNYRPIYHVELYMYKLMSVIHGSVSTSTSTIDDDMISLPPPPPHTTIDMGTSCQVDTTI